MHTRRCVCMRGPCFGGSDTPMATHKAQILLLDANLQERNRGGFGEGLALGEGLTFGLRRGRCRTNLHRLVVPPSENGPYRKDPEASSKGAHWTDPRPYGQQSKQ